MPTTYQFPDADTLRLALTTGTVPADVALAPARAGLAGAAPWIEPSAAVPRAAQTALKKFGVALLRSAPAGDARDVSCWLQILPVERDPAPPQFGAQTPVLFEVPRADLLPPIVTEMLRLKNDRQSYRWLRSEDGTDGGVLLRVVGPPYYTLLRALERDRDGGPSVRAYLERAPRVWVEVGHTQPLVESVRPPEGKLLLVRPPHEWTFLDDEPFRDVYEVLEFEVPGGRTDYRDTELGEKLDVPLRLAPGAAGEAAELWVLHENAEGQLDALVRDADERLLHRLAFAVGEQGGRTTFVLRVRPSKQAPPELVLAAQRFRPYRGLPNLFLPVGTSLQPPLRRDAVRKLLAADPARVTWLFPAGDGDFVPETLPDEAFRPLEDWVNYVITREREPLAEWVGATEFDFDSFVCSEDQPAAPKDAPGKGKGKDRRGGRGGDEDFADDVKFVAVPAKADGPRPEPVEAEAPAVLEPTQAQKRLRELEEKFLAVEGDLDAPERQALWPELARLNGSLKNAADAAVCWVNGIWERAEPPADWLDGWVSTESKKASAPLGPADLDALMAQSNPGPADLRAVVAVVVQAARRKPVPAELTKRLPAVRQFVEAHEDLLGVRAAWLAWWHLAQASGADVLGLARARDRLLGRLLTDGLNPERDLPGFIRFAGQRDSDRLRVVREKASKLHQAAAGWATAGGLELNRPFVDATFAFGMARLGESTAARELLDQAGAALKKGTDVHAFLFDAYKFRIDQAIAGKPATGPLSPDLMEMLELIGGETGPGRLNRYIVDRLREQSPILEPQEKFDPYRMWKRHNDDLFTELAKLPDERDPGRLADTVRRLMREGSKGRVTAETQLAVLNDALPLAFRVGEPFARELLAQVTPAIDGVPVTNSPADAPLLEKQGIVLERAMFLAGHYDLLELVQRFAERFVRLIGGKPSKEKFEAIARITGVTLKSFRKLGLKDETHDLLASIRTAVLQNQEVAVARAKAGVGWPDMLKALLHLSGGWLYFGWVDKALPVFDEARRVLFRGEPDGPADRPVPVEYTKVVCAYIAALGQAPIDVALPRIEELFRRMDPLPNTYTTATHFSRLHLNVVEAVVMAVVQDDFAVGPAVRKWLDEDEYLVRRRVHRDLRAAMG